MLILLRDYVRRHNRLPRVLVVDNGKEFHSRELEDFCKIYGIDLRFRGPGMPRGGAMIERLLGAAEDEVISEMAGNTRAMKKDTRLVTKSVDPFRRAEWTLYAAYHALQEYLFEVRPNRVHPAIGETPNDYETRRLAETGVREHRLFKLDENLMLMTSPHARRPFHIVDRQRGVWVDGLWYRHPAMTEVKRKEKVEVRVEPWNASVVYVFIKNRWVAAVGASSRWLIGRTRREVEIALREESRLAKVLANKGTFGTKTTKHKQRLWTPSNFDARLAEQQKEMVYLYGKMGMTNAMPSPTEVATPPVAATGASTPTPAAEPAPATSAQVPGGSDPTTSPQLDSEMAARDCASLDAESSDVLRSAPGYY